MTQTTDNYPAHVMEAGGPDHYAAGQAQALHCSILAADWDAVREIAADPYTPGDDVDFAKGALAGAGEPLTVDVAKVESLFDAAAKVAPAPETREGANRETWVKYYAAVALAAYATFRAEIRTLTPRPAPGSRPDLGYLMEAATSATAAAAALTDQTDYAPKLIWDLTPESGAFNGEWEEWLADVLVRRGINPGHIDPDLNPDDFTEAVRTLGPRSDPYVCDDCGETAYLHFPDCSVNQS